MKIKGVYLRGKIFWLRYSINGRRIFESAETSDRKTAELLLKKRMVEIHEGKHFGKVKELRIPLVQAIGQYLSIIRERKSSWADDEMVLRKFSAHLGPSAFLQDIDRLTIEDFQTSLLASGISKARVNRYIALIKAFFNRCIEWGKNKNNPVKGIKLYPESMRIRYLELGQIHALLESTSDRMRPIVLTALLTGLRKGDIFNLRWNQIDFENRKIWIQQKKTGTPLIINMSEALVEVFVGVTPDPDCPYVFHNDGKHLSRFGWVRTDFVKAMKSAGVKDFRFHDLRHTFATQQRFLGRDIAVIKELLGHKSIKMTMRYAHIRPEELKEAVDQLGQKILGKDTKKIQSQTVVPSEVFKNSEQTFVNHSEEQQSGRWQSGQMHQTVNPTDLPSGDPPK